MTINVPTSWEEVTIGQLQELKDCKDLIEKVAVLTDQDPDFVSKWDVNSFNEVCEKLNFITSVPTDENWKKEIELNGETYYFKEKLSEMSAGRWLDMVTWCNDFDNNIHKIVGYLYGMDYEKAKDLKVSDCYGAVVFFSNIAKELLESMQAYFRRKLLIHQAKQTLKELREFEKSERKQSGIGFHSFTNWLKGVQLN